MLRDGTAVLEARERLDRLSAEIEALVARWEELETIAAAGVIGPYTASRKTLWKRESNGTTCVNSTAVS